MREMHTENIKDCEQEIIRESIINTESNEQPIEDISNKYKTQTEELKITHINKEEIHSRASTQNEETHHEEPITKRQALVENTITNNTIVADIEPLNTNINPWTEFDSLDEDIENPDEEMWNDVEDLDKEISQQYDNVTQTDIEFIKSLNTNNISNEEPIEDNKNTIIKPYSYEINVKNIINKMTLKNYSSKFKRLLEINAENTEASEVILDKVLNKIFKSKTQIELYALLLKDIIFNQLNATEPNLIKSLLNKFIILFWQRYKKEHTAKVLEIIKLIADLLNKELIHHAIVLEILKILLTFKDKSDEHKELDVGLACNLMETIHFSLNKAKDIKEFGMTKLKALLTKNIPHEVKIRIEDLLKVKEDTYQKQALNNLISNL